MRSRLRWEENRKGILINYEDVEWISLAQDRDQMQAVISTAMYPSISYNGRNQLNYIQSACQ
jgi:hypothetical protein